MASDYELPGAIAQLGERLAGSQKVAGSSPASSTPPKAAREIGRPSAFVVRPAPALAGGYRATSRYTGPVSDMA